MNLKHFVLFFGAAVLMLTVSCQRHSEANKYNASLMDFIFEGLENTRKLQKIRLHAYFQENPEKYGAAYRIGEKVVSINELFVDRVDTMLRNNGGIIDKKEFYQLFVATTDSLNNCLKLVGLPKWFDARSFTEQQPEANELTLLLAKQASTQYCNEILGYLAEDMSFSGWVFPNVQYELVNNKLILQDKIFQRYENRALEISSFTKDGIPVEGKIKSKNSHAFCEISFDSLPPGKYKIKGMLKLLVGESRFMEEPLEYVFTID